MTLGMLRRHPMLAFFLLSCAYSWTGFLLFAFSRAGLLPFKLPGEVPLLAEYGPTFAGLMLTGVAGGRAAVKALLARGLRWRIGIGWWLVTLFLAPAVVMATVGVRTLLGYSHPDWSLMLGWGPRFVDHMRGLTPSVGLVSGLVGFMEKGMLQTVAGAVVVAIMSGGVTEEFGFRGYAQPHLQRRWSALRSAVVVGIMWGVWHVGPWHLFLVTDARSALVENGVWILDYLLATIPLAVLMAWLMRNTGGSVLVAIVFHAALNTTMATLFNAWPEFPHYWVKAMLWVTAGLVVATHGRELIRVPARRGESVPEALPAVASCG
jgi:membrane protease YdiL (CAAX protease family)